MNYYNERDLFAAAWLRNLIAAGLLPDGYVDERSIVDVQPSDLEGYIQCHFFAGIGGWSRALELAGWPSDAPVWTGSCPCQPFSHAGRGKRTSDPRHLWPKFARLIAERRPPVVFGEQTASDYGREWLAGVRADLESVDYAVGAADLCAASLGAPHIRSRLWWVAESSMARWPQASTGPALHAENQPESGRRALDSGMADAINTRYSESRLGSMASASTETGTETSQRKRHGRDTGHRSAVRGVGNADESRRQGLSGSNPAHQWTAWQTGAGFWDDAEFIPCLDGKSRRIEPGTPPLVDGFPGRVGQLRAYGNAIVPQVAAEFVKAYMIAED